MVIFRLPVQKMYTISLHVFDTSLGIALNVQSSKLEPLLQMTSAKPAVRPASKADPDVKLPDRYPVSVQKLSASSKVKFSEHNACQPFVPLISKKPFGDSGSSRRTA